MLDRLYKEFVTPDAQYGPIPFYWWTGEPLSLERICWQLDRLKENGFYGVNVNYTHSTAGTSYRGSPELFTDDWWQLWDQVVRECERRGMVIGFDDYLRGPV